MKIKNLFLAAAILTIATSATANEDPSGSVIAASGGRFAFGQVSSFAKHQFLLDTQTGRLWKMVCVVEAGDITNPAAKCVYNKLEPVYFGHDGGVVSHTPDGKKYRLIDGEPSGADDSTTSSKK